MPKGYKRGKGVPSLHDELKTRVNLALTPTGIKGLDTLADNLNISRSELVERIGRGMIPVATFPSVPLSNRDTLPNRPALYLVIEADRILYIGQSIDLKTELLNLSYLQEFNSENDNLRIAWVECSNTDLLPTLEKLLISTLKLRVKNDLVGYEKELGCSQDYTPTISVNIPVNFMSQILVAKTTLNNDYSLGNNKLVGNEYKDEKTVQTDLQKDFFVGLLESLRQLVQEWETKLHANDYS